MPFFMKPVPRCVVCLSLLGVLLACGPTGGSDGGTEEDSGTPDDRPQVDDQRVTLLSVLEPTDGTTFMVEHLVTVTVGITSSGAAASQSEVTVGLMERPAASASDADLASLTLCSLGTVMLKFSGGNAEEVFATQSFVMPRECVPSGSGSKTFNLWASLDPFDRVAEQAAGAEEDNLVVYNERELASAANQACRNNPSPDAPKGCVFSLVVGANTGIDLEFDAMAPQSSVAILYPDSDHPHLKAGADEYNPPLVTMSSTLLVAGQEPRDDDGNFQLDDDNALSVAAAMTYTIRAKNAASGEPALPLTIHAGNNAASGHGASAAVQKLVSGSPSHFTHGLVAEGATRQALATGGLWADQTEFTIKGCVTTTETEVSVSGGSATENNCHQANVILVRSSANATLANSYSLSGGWKNSYGSSGTVQLNIDLGSQNVLDLSGASSATHAIIDVDSLAGHIPVVDAEASGDAFVAIVGSGVDASLKVFGQNVYSYSRRVPEFTYQRDFSLTKSLCATFSYGVVVVSLDVQLCFSGTAGLGLDFAITAKTGSGAAPFDSATKIGDATAKVTPSATMNGTASASVNVTIARGGASGTLTLLDLQLPLDADLKWGLVSGPALAMVANGTWQLDLDSLDGHIDLFADTRSLDWCKHWGIKYPCGFSWNRVYAKRLATFTGLKYNQTLLSRQYTATLQ
jgi:hypothetical protein